MSSRTFTKKDAARALREAHGGISLDEAKDLVEAILGTIEEGLVRDGEVKIRGFGSFEVKLREARVSKHPRTGADVHIPEAQVVRFRQSKMLFAKMNKGL